MNDKNPKDYWKILNSLDNTPENADIKLEDLYSFFKDLNYNPNNGAENTDNIYLLFNEVEPFPGCLRLGLSWFNWWVSFAPEFLCCYFCESSCLFYLSFNFDFYVSKIMHL